MCKRVIRRFRKVGRFQKHVQDDVQISPRDAFPRPPHRWERVQEVLKRLKWECRCGYVGADVVESSKQHPSIHPPPSCVQSWVPEVNRTGCTFFPHSLVAKKKKGALTYAQRFPQKARFPWVIRNEWDVRHWSLWRKTHSFGQEVYFGVWPAGTTH